MYILWIFINQESIKGGIVSKITINVFTKYILGSTPEPLKPALFSHTFIYYKFSCISMKRTKLYNRYVHILCDTTLSLDVSLDLSIQEN
jgi:hypothetical protein